MSDEVAISLVTTLPVLIAQLGLFVQGLHGHRATQQVQQSVGDANGENLHELLVEISKLVEYQHGRNHDILAVLGTLSERVEQLAHQPGR